MVGFQGTLLFINLVLPKFVIGLAVTDASVNRLFIVLVVIWTLMSLMGAITYRLANSGGEQEKRYV